MSSHLLVSEAFELYRTDHIVMSNLSPKTEESYGVAGKLLVRFTGDVNICRFTFENARDWRRWLLEWQSNDTARGNIICLRMVLKFLRTRGYSVLDWESIPVAKRTKRTIRFLTQEEVAGFIREVSTRRRGYSEENRLRNIAIVTLLYATGLRNSELCSLDRDKIRNRTFTISGKSERERIGFIDESAENAIEDYLSVRSDNDKALFTSRQTGERITDDTIRKIFKNVCARSDFKDVHPHTIRHSYATKLLEKEVDIRYIGDLMGHADLNTTKIYTHYSNPKLRAIYEKAHEI